MRATMALAGVAWLVLASATAIDARDERSPSVTPPSEAIAASRDETATPYVETCSREPVASPRIAF